MDARTRKLSRLYRRFMGDYVRAVHERWEAERSGDTLDAIGAVEAMAEAEASLAVYVQAKHPTRRVMAEPEPARPGAHAVHKLGLTGSAPACDQSDLPAGMRRCRMCGAVQAIHEFTRSPTHALGYSYVCKPCEKVRKRAQYARRKEAENVG